MIPCVICSAWRLGFVQSKRDGAARQELSHQTLRRVKLPTARWTLDTCSFDPPKSATSPAVPAVPPPPGSPRVPVVESFSCTAASRLDSKVACFAPCPSSIFPRAARSTSSSPHPLLGRPDSRRCCVASANACTNFRPRRSRWRSRARLTKQERNDWLGLDSRRRGHQRVGVRLVEVSSSHLVPHLEPEARLTRVHTTSILRT